MKKVLLYVFLFLPQFLAAQHVVILTVTQPPEFGFLLSKHDTTIRKGNSVMLGTDLVIFGGSGEYSYKWSPGKVLNDSLILNPIASPVDTTIYKLMVTDKNGCSFSVTYKVNVTFQEVKSNFVPAGQNLDAVVFPNPSEGNIKILLSGIPAKKVEMTIIDNTGKIIKRVNISNFSGNHTELLHLNMVSGVYHLRIESELSTISRQFVIH
jgi:hypothetical protein